MNNNNRDDDRFDPEVQVVDTPPPTLDALNKSEVGMQIDAAHRYPRSITKCVLEATSLATMTPEIAESCMYSLPRDGKMITGPSVRLAEMIATSWTNIYMGSRIVDIGPREIRAQSVVWDLERNVRVTTELPRSIVTKNGKRYGDSMIQTTGAAAISIALRNGVFRVIPKAFVDQVYNESRRVAVGDAKTLDHKRTVVLERLQKMGATKERILARIGVSNPLDITLSHLETLIGLGTAIKDGALSVDEAFPALERKKPAAPEQSKGSALDQIVDHHKGAQKANDSSPAQAAPEPPANQPPANDAESPSEEPAPAAERPEPPAPASVEVQAALEGIDKRWGGEPAAETIAAWSPEQRASAYDWAIAPEEHEQPEHCVLLPEPRRRKAAGAK